MRRFKNSIISSHQFLPSWWRQTLKCDPGAANTFEILVAQQRISAVKLFSTKETTVIFALKAVL